MTDARTSRWDAATVLIVFLVLLLFLPSALVLQALGSAGAPSSLVGIGAFFLWAWFHLQRDRSFDVGFQPVRAALLGWLLVMLASYAHAMAGPIPFDEISVADSGMLRLVSFSGILLLTHDGITSRDRYLTLMRWLVIGTGLIAVFGLVQYVTGELYIDRLQIPGLLNGSQGIGIGERGGFVRPSGTSTSPIEYGVVLTVTLPFAVTLAHSAPSRRWLYRGCVTAIAFAIFLSGSRSALLCALIGLAVLAMFWGYRNRLLAAAAVTTIGAVIYLTVPGALGSLTNMFTRAGEDPSIASRTGSYDIALHFIAEHPWLGRGFGTFLPKYWILDNGYLGLLIGAGVVGFVGFLVLFGTGAAAALRVHRQASSPLDRELGQATLASITAGAVALAFFDTFAFPQAAGPLFLVLGMAGALRRLTMAPTPVRDRDRELERR